MMEYGSDKLQVLLDAAGNDFLGFSSISGDADCLNGALALLTDEQRGLLVGVMEEGGKLLAAKKLGGTDLVKVIEANQRISAALKDLRRKFGTFAETYRPRDRD